MGILTSDEVFVVAGAVAYPQIEALPAWRAEPGDSPPPGRAFDLSESSSSATQQIVSGAC
jgi:hypothetical protein